MTTPTISFEIELALSGTVVPYQAATGPTYSSGGQPAEGGYAEDVDIEDIGIIELDYAQRNPSHPRGVWVTRTLLDGIDKKDPAIRKLFANILAMKGEEASAAVCEAEQ